jgi:hypothetical protein
MYFMVKDLKGSKRTLCGREQDDKTARWIWGQPIFRQTQWRFLLCNDM